MKYFELDDTYSVKINHTGLISVYRHDELMEDYEPDNILIAAIYALDEAVG